jgi:glycosyltransferase involved in cell wall biosynthesis
MLGLAPDLFVVGCTARLAPAKGQRILLHAVAALRSTIPGIRLVLVGDGPERPALERLTRQLELTGHVIFLGMRDDARALLPAFEVFAAPSLTEGMPFAILEAMAAARPILATRVGGVPEALADGQAGILVDPGRPEPLIDGLDRLFREPRLRHELSSAARKRLVERFSIDAMLDKTEAAFLAAGGAVPPAARHARAFVAV